MEILTKNWRQLRKFNSQWQNHNVVVVTDMSENNNQTSLSNDNGGGSEFPVAAIVCLSVGGYVLLVILFLTVRRMLVTKGSCQADSCCPESDISCSICAKINESCLSCCSSPDTQGCCAAICGGPKKTNCRDLLCCSPSCTGRCSDTCSGLIPKFSCDCTCLSGGCCAGEPCCLSCFENELEPNACGCLCLEIKLRTSKCGTIKKSTSAPPLDAQNQHYTSHEQTDGAVDYHHDNMYHGSGKLANGTTKNSLDKFQIGGDNNQEQQSSSSLSPAKKSNRYLMPSNRSNNATIPDILSADSTGRHSHPIDKSNTHVNFQGTFEEPFANSGSSNYLPSTTVLTTSSSGDSQNMSSKSLLNKSTNTDSSRDINGRPTSRSRKSVHPGKISQRFPNKVLVSSESFKSSLEKSRSSVPEVSFIQSSDKSLPNMSTNFDALSYQRPLPSTTKTVKSLT